MSAWTVAVAAITTPALWWRLADTAGTACADASGSGHPGVRSGATITTALAGPLYSDSDESMSFTGTNPVAQVAYGAWAENSSTYSISFFFKSGTLAASNVLIARDHQSGGRRFQVTIDSAGRLGFALFLTTNTFSTITTTTTYNDGLWHFVSVVYDGTLGATVNRQKIYVDNVNVSTQNGGTAAGANASGIAVPFSVGNATRTTQAPANCTLDEILYWPGLALTGAQHQALWVAANTPGPPTSVAASGATPTTLDLSWSVPAGGGLAPTSYQVRLNGGAPSTQSSPYTFTGLTAGTAYTLEVRAVGPGGSSSWVSVSASTTAPPNVPTSVAASPDFTTIDLTWSAPSGGGSVSSYEVRIDGGTEATATSPHTFTGLVLGTAYTLEVRAVGPGGESAWVTLVASTLALTGLYSFEVVVGDHSWSIEEADAAELSTILAGLKVTWSARQDDGWPTQHNPMVAVFGVIVAEAVDLSDIDLGTPVYLRLTIDGFELLEFGGTIRDLDARPHPLGMVYQITALDYLVDLRGKTIHAEITDAAADFEDIWDILTDGVLPSGMPSLFDPPDFPYPGDLGTFGSTWVIDGNAMDVLVGYFGEHVSGGPTGGRFIIVPNLTDGLPDPDHPYLAILARQVVGDRVDLTADEVPTDAVSFRRLRQEPNRAEEWQGGVVLFASERDHDGIPTITRVLNNDNVSVPTTNVAWIAGNLEDLPNQWSTGWRYRAWEDPSPVAGWFTMPEAMRTLVRISDIDPRHNPSGEATYSGMLGGASLVVDPRGRWRVDFTLRRSVPAGTDLDA